MSSTTVLCRPSRRKHLLLILGFAVGLSGNGYSQSPQAALEPSSDSTAETSPSPLSLVSDDQHVSINRGAVELLRYNKTALPAPQGIDPSYARSGYIHPVRTPRGVMVTGDFAADHPHQHAIFSAWTNTTYDGHRVDFWNQHKKTGLVSYLSSGAEQEGKLGVSFNVQQKHDALKVADQPLTILEEEWKVTAVSSDNSSTSPYFIFDIELTQTCVADKPLILNEYLYGGMGFRGNNQWFSDESAKALSKLKPETTDAADYPPIEITRHRFLTSEGKRRLAGNHSRPDWVDLSGLVDGKMAGITVMSHPSNFRHPQPVRLHPNKPYFCFSPCVLGAFEMKPGETYRARYRYVVHDGEPDVTRLNELFQEYSQE
ncbi:DUF6807 domain-containing protein [Stieleria varia]|uniref:Methane oxygenase PmoA n=1 Tax=Stieleria varia TaxID=2528005 RepID=A0A5C6A4N6_9BACT|nr:PmoA family protein [Stieleria varia]TWT93343.1 hypothetical protein Pla52n_60030 [Stieleria varia]